MSYTEEDFKELQHIIDTCKSATLKADFMSLSEKIKIQLENEKSRVSAPTPTPVSVSTAAEDKCNYIKLADYAWENLSETVKIYLTFKEANKIPKGSIAATFTSETAELCVRNVNGNNYRFFVRVANEIDPKKCIVKTTSSKVIVVLKKTQQTTWTQLEKKEVKTPKIPKFDKDADPNTALMEMMKNLYEEGDDEAKRMIAKSWSEARNKGKDSLLNDLPK